MDKLKINGKLYSAQVVLNDAAQTYAPVISGGGGGGGSSLSDIILTDDSNTQFIARDSGISITYITLAGANYTPTTNVRAISSGGGGSATSALQTAGNTSLSTIASNGATSALQTAGNTSLSTIATAQGTSGTGIVQPTGGAGLLGWLSGIYQKLSGSIAVTGTFYQATQPVSGTVSVSTGGTSIVAGQAKLTAAGTAQALPANPLTSGITITANINNTGIITVGAAGVNNIVNGTGNGIRLSPGQSYAYSVSNSNVVYFNGTVTGDTIDFGGN